MFGRAALVVALVLAALGSSCSEAEAGFRNFRRNPNGPAAKAPEPPPGTTLFSVLAPGSAETTECANADFTAVTSQAITGGGAATRTCEKADGTLVTSTLNKPRVMSVSGELAFLVENSRSNLCLRSNDLANATWVKTNMTCVKNATGPTGVANSASTCTATANNATVLQQLTQTAQDRVLSVRLKRVTGTGTVELTLNGGTNWVDVTAGLATNRYNRMVWTTYPGLKVALIANPNVGMRLGTNGDVVEVAYFQEEGTSTSAPYTSDIETTSAAVNPGAETVNLSNPLFGLNPVHYFLQATVTPYDRVVGAWGTLSSGRQAVNVGTGGANSATLQVASGAPSGNVRDVSSNTKTATAASALTAGAHTVVLAVSAGVLTVYRDGVIDANPGSGTGTGIVTTQGSTATIGGNGGSSALCGFVSNIKIGIGAWPPAP